MTEEVKPIAWRWKDPTGEWHYSAGSGYVQRLLDSGVAIFPLYDNPPSLARERDELREALDTIKAAISQMETEERGCPILRPNCSKADFEKCSKCGATRNQNCGIQLSAESKALLVINGVLSKETDNEG